MTSIAKRIKLAFDAKSRQLLLVMERISKSIILYRENRDIFYDMDRLYMVEVNNSLHIKSYLVTYQVRNRKYLYKSILYELICDGDVFLYIGGEEKIVEEKEICLNNFLNINHKVYVFNTDTLYEILKYITNLTIIWSIVNYIGNNKMFDKYLLKYIFKYNSHNHINIHWLYGL